MINLSIAIVVGIVVMVVFNVTPIFFLFSMWLTMIYLEIQDLRYELKTRSEE